MKRSQKKLLYNFQKISETQIGEILAYEGQGAIRASIYRVTGTLNLPVWSDGDYLVISGKQLDQLVSLIREVSPNWNPQVKYTEVTQSEVVVKDHFLQDEQ